MAALIDSYGGWEMSIWRRVRAAATIGLLWGAAWTATMLILLIVLNTWDVMHGGNFGFVRPRYLALTMLRMFTLGVTIGFGFSVILARVERTRAVASLGLARLSLWGGIASAIAIGIAIAALETYTLPAARIVEIMAVYGAVGAASAAGTLLLARRGRDVALPFVEAPAQIS